MLIFEFVLHFVQFHNHQNKQFNYYLNYSFIDITTKIIHKSFLVIINLR